MELERIIKELELKNDINTLNSFKIVKKYASNEEDAKEFMEKLAKLFERKNMYAVNVIDKYDKISDVTKKINEKYENSEIADCAKSISLAMEREYSYLSRRDKDLEAQIESVYLILDSLGVTTYNESLSYTDLVSTLYDKTLSLKDYTKNGIVIPTIDEINYSYNRTLNDKNEIKDLKAIKFFYQYFPLMNLCFDKEFLVTSNYLLGSSNVSEETKKHLVGITYQIIDMSLSFPPIKGFNDISYNRKEYKKVVKKTISNINRYLKTIEKKDNKVKTNKKEF